MRPLAILAALTISADVAAGRGGDVLPDGPAASAAEIPALADLLDRAGWQPTPELSGAFRAGSIFVATDMGHQLALSDCFPGEVVESAYTQAEVITQLQAGVRVDLGAGSVGGSAGVVKKLKFGAPSHRALPALEMTPTDACRSRLLAAPARGWDLSKMYAVKEVLRAEIAEQTCGRVDAQGRFVGLGSAEVELAAACAQVSLEPVAVAFRTLRVEELIGPAAAPGVTLSMTAPSGESRADHLDLTLPLAGGGWRWSDASGEPVAGAQRRELMTALKRTQGGAEVLRLRSGLYLVGGMTMLGGSAPAVLGARYGFTSVLGAAAAIEAMGAGMIVAGGLTGRQRLLAIADEELAKPYEP